MDEQLKQQLMPAVVVFNLTAVAYLTIRAVYPIVILGKNMSTGQFMTHLLVAAGIGLVAGGITLGVMMMKK